MATRKPFLLRINPALLAEVEAWAQNDLRSVNGQIEYVLKQAVAKRKGNAAVRKEGDQNSGQGELTGGKAPD